MKTIVMKTETKLLPFSEPGQVPSSVSALLSVNAKITITASKHTVQNIAY